MIGVLRTRLSAHPGKTYRTFRFTFRDDDCDNAPTNLKQREAVGKHRRTVHWIQAVAIAKTEGPGFKGEETVKKVRLESDGAFANPGCKPNVGPSCFRLKSAIRAIPRYIVEVPLVSGAECHVKRGAEFPTEVRISRPSRSDVTTVCGAWRERTRRAS
jgi:hypothetical protein